MRNPIKTSSLLLGVGGLVLLLGAFWSARQVERAAWPHVDAELVAVRIVDEQSRDRPGGPAYAVFRPEIRYRYRTPDGVTAEANGFADGWRKTIAPAERFVSEHPVGSRSRLSFMPGHPEQVRFGLALSLSTLWQPLLTAGAGLFCGAIAWIGKRRFRSGWSGGKAALA
jgi:hypothetical protein